MLSLIVARAKNGAIGRDNDIPWHLPADLKMFQRETTGGCVIMGRRTWESLPVKPLPKRLNLVVSRAGDLGVETCATVEEAIAKGYAEGYQRLYGMGGAGIYAALLPLAERLLLTEVDLEIPDADTFFPDFAESEWREISRREIEGDGPKAVLRELIRR